MTKEQINKISDIDLKKLQRALLLIETGAQENVDEEFLKKFNLTKKDILKQFGDFLSINLNNESAIFPIFIIATYDDFKTCVKYFLQGNSITETEMLYNQMLFKRAKEKMLEESKNIKTKR